MPAAAVLLLLLLLLLLWRRRRRRRLGRVRQGAGAAEGACARVRVSCLRVRAVRGAVPRASSFKHSS